MLSKKDTRQALARARKELTESKPVDYTGGEADGHVQKTNPDGYVEFADWTICELCVSN